ncbi:MAG TPA: serine/threonine-protein kinase [Myxococcota bacterium]|nr:serine/threonine-protein kinase [Myxococcota bacterium]HOC98578.1 serine/threonine-protein kinase [Myxococcota bacterium]HOH77202.1 serine/threonine-protein kinase [Myxococcota bacterium]
MGFKGQTAVAGFGAAAEGDAGKKAGSKPSASEAKLLAGRFRLTRMIASGGMGMVFLARQTSIDRDVAIKILNPDKAGDKEARDRFRVEAAAVSRLKSPHTVTVFDFGEDEQGNMFLAMEFLEGRPLSTYLKERGPIEPRLVVEIADQVLDSLSEAHSAGILHRDLKPENIFVMDRSIREVFVKVLDFGVAKIIGGPTHAGTMAGKVFGTPSYMSPEQLMGKSLDARTDLYSLGVVMYELLTGKLPINGRTPIEIGVRKVKDVPPRIDQVLPEAGFPPGMVDFIARTVDPRIEARPTDDVEFRDLMHAAFDRRATSQVSGIHSAPSPEPGPADPSRRDTVPTRAMTNPFEDVAAQDRPNRPTPRPASSGATVRPMTVAMSSRDRRKTRRMPKLLGVRLMSAGQSVSATASDVSPGGGFINAREIPVVGHRIVVAFKRPDSTAFDIQIAAEVTRIATGEGAQDPIRGFGVRWLRLRAPGEIEPVVKFLTKVLGIDPPTIQPPSARGAFWEYSFTEGRFI